MSQMPAHPHNGDFQRDVLPELDPPYRLLLGPGPCNVDPRVLRIGAAPQLGHLDPALFTIMAETAELLRWMFQTHNALTCCVSGSGFSGAEAVLSNLLEPGDTIIAGSLGFFSGKIAEISQRAGANVVLVETEPGTPLAASALEKAFQEHPETKIFATAIAETSTGLQQPLAELERVTHAHNALFVVDSVCGLGGIPVSVDAMKIDACYSGSQKCLGALPGLAPVTLNERAVDTIKRRRTPVQSYYLDLLALHRYWNEDHAYHHTICSNLVYGMREALRLAQQEGLEARFARHKLHGDAFQAGIRALGLKLLTRPGYELPVLTAVLIPDDVDEPALRKVLLDEYSIEVGGGLGTFKGRMFRVGLMGYNAQRQTVYTMLNTLEHVLPKCGYALPEPGAALKIAEDFYSEHAH
ncbi:pyridoxal-phosphate-dependent aminotransferase family protein [Ktedonospora formicarum]|uniref:Alanine--glyoxylate aminotransferase n=1 Tax=Ktedonospora formicarum TaxID=2778364 RepID=A0A8J3HST1_9CHLR|nr:alanine--glyoxylate aminotransferase family protein [Ktedonospora formicarum]GHO43307.1 alanine--glyoxylate aminotransferase [Ktedonospora formicarum]